MMEEPKPNDFSQTLSHSIQGILSHLKALRTRAIRWWQTLDLQYKRLLLALGASMLLIVVILAIWKIPQQQLAPLKAKIQRERNSLQPEDRLKLEHDARKLENDARTTLVQAVGGAVLLMGLFFTWRSIRATERNLQITQEAAAKNLTIALDGQITERFTRAIEQLGSDRLEIRLGAIYALERIARDSERDYWPIMEILTAYVREHAPLRAEPFSQEDVPPSETPPKTLWSHPKPAADIQAILTVLGRRARIYRSGDQRLDLAETDLRGVRLWGAHLEGAELRAANLEGADLRGIHLEMANLPNIQLKRAYLRAAHLEWTQLMRAHLEGATLFEAHLEKANLLEAHLEGAALRDAYFEEVNLADAHLEGAHLWGVHLKGVRNLRVEQLAAVKTLHQAHLDPPLREQVEQQYPHLLEYPRRPDGPES